ncbi:MAG: PCRF domain-containing protein, partial [Clostridia bacterium]|nr:PCRF domain-containing protein [Clostridia bacterium]
MFEKLDALEERYDELGRLLVQPQVISDPEQFKKNAKAHAALEEIVSCYREFKKVKRDLEEAKALLGEKLEAEFRELVMDEIDELEARKEELERNLKLLLMPKDPNDEKNVI